MESVDYVISNKDRYALMALIVREFDFAEDLPEDLAEKYSEDIITHRNKLAHSKLFYGECKKKLFISKKREPLKCNQNCDQCKSQYTIGTCEEIRRQLFEYYKLFQKINTDTSEHLERTKQHAGV